ncbi:MAG TPA: pyridoxamine 5'-phosphate oxidase, partial [Gemmatimonadaceae bacterium]|nr:pyridoxamine 5'-phosphate oxidase [Gemmatimonadaceae bacterium]
TTDGSTPPAPPNGASELEDPIARFEKLLAAAQAVDRTRLPEPTAMTLATIGTDGQPSARIVLLKSVGSDGFVFYTNLRSRKGADLVHSPRAALCFHWQPLEVQVRVEGTVELVPDAEADAYFATRPRISQLGAWASDQSAPLAAYTELEARLREAEQRFTGLAVPRPSHWSGYRLEPRAIEFWRSRPFRLHERQLYERHSGGWRTTLLFP